LVTFIDREDLETLSERDAANIILSNIDIMNETGHPFDVDQILLSAICEKVNSTNDIENKRLRIIRKATIILCEIAHCQPFLEGNRTTAFYTGMVFMRKNGFHLPLNTPTDKNAIFDLLTRTKEKDIGTEDILCEEIEDYLKQKVIATI